MTLQKTTSWRPIALAIVAALTASFQIGKAIVALPLLQSAPLHLGLRETGLVISALAVIGAFFAMPMGVFIARWDARKVLVAGLLVVALASWIGGSASSIALLIASRVLEGIAVVGLLVCASSVVGRQASAADRDLAMALSSTAVPSGIALVIFTATLVSALGLPLSWSAIWYVNAGLAFGCALLVGCGLPAMPAVPAHTGSVASPLPASSVWEAICRVATARGVQFIAICFGLYATIYFAFSGFLLLLLRDLLGLTPVQAGFVSAGIVASNVLGNISAGALMRRGVASRQIVTASFLIAALCIPALFWLQLPAALAVVIAAGMVGCMGAIPGALTASAPTMAPSPWLIAPSLGLMMQGSYVGQLVGPVSAGVLAQLGGWPLVAGLLLPLALCGALLARKL